MDTIDINDLPVTYQYSIKSFIQANPHCGLDYPIGIYATMNFRDALDCYLRWEGILDWTDVILTFITVMNAGEAKPLPDEHKLVEAMRMYGGGFARSLATAWQQANSSNVRRLRREFNGLLETYQQFLPKEVPEFLKKDRHASPSK